MIHLHIYTETNLMKQSKKINGKFIAINFGLFHLGPFWRRLQWNYRAKIALQILPSYTGAVQHCSRKDKGTLVYIH